MLSRITLYGHLVDHKLSYPQISRWGWRDFLLKKKICNLTLIIHKSLSAMPDLSSYDHSQLINSITDDEFVHLYVPNAYNL